MGSRSSRTIIQSVAPLEKYQIDKSKKYQNLILEGGGVKGIAYLGAIRALEEKDILKDIHRYAGTSVGAIYATILAIGYTSKEIRDVLYDLDFTTLLDNHYCLPISIYDILKKFGYCEGDTIQKLIKECILAKTGDANLTFADLYTKYNKELVIVGCNLNRLREVHFSHKNTPDMPIYKAVRISASYPFIFKPVEYEGDLYVDGGVVNNYPLYVFDNIDETIGLKLLTESEEPSEHIYNKRESIDDICEYSIALLRAISIAAERNHIRDDDYWKHTICINTGSISTTKYSITQEDKDFLISNGYNATKAYLEKLSYNKMNKY